MFKNYCVVILGNTDGAERDVIGIADSNLSSFTAGGLCIYTFTSAVNASEMSDWFKSHKRNFLFFELSEKTSGYNINHGDIQEKLFGFLKDQNLLELNTKFDESVVGEEIDFVELPPEEPTVSVEDVINGMSEVEKKNMLNELLEKTNLTDNDKIILQFLVK